MHDKIKNLIIDKDISIPKILFYNIDKLEINFEELYYLIYFMDNSSSNFDMTKVCNDLGKKPKNVLQVVNDLDEKKLIKLEVIKNEKETYEIINLKGLYEKLTFLIIDREEKVEKKIDLISEIEKVFKRPLIPREKQIVKTWTLVGYNDDFVLAGIQESDYNKEYSITYIDTVLDNWSNLGFKTVEDIKKARIINPKEVEIELPNIEFEEGFNWMDE